MGPEDTGLRRRFRYLAPRPPAPQTREAERDQMSDRTWIEVECAPQDVDAINAAIGGSEDGDDCTDGLVTLLLPDSSPQCLHEAAGAGVPFLWRHGSHSGAYDAYMGYCDPSENSIGDEWGYTETGGGMAVDCDDNFVPRPGILEELRKFGVAYNAVKAEVLRRTKEDHEGVQALEAQA